MEELKHALKEYNMGDEKTIKEIIAEVETDRVCTLFPLNRLLQIGQHLFPVHKYCI